MVKGISKHSLGGTKGKESNWKTTKTDGAKKGIIFDPSASSLRKNKEYLELKREIALKGANIYMIMFYQISDFKYKGMLLYSSLLCLRNFAWKCFCTIIIARYARKVKEEKKRQNIEEDRPEYYVDRDRAIAVSESKDIKSQLRVVHIINIALSITPSISMVVTWPSILIEITYNSSKKISKIEARAGEGNNPFFNLGGMGTGADENYDACLTQGEHELK